MSRTPPPALEVEEVSHFYGARKALDRVSLHVEAGRFTALLGPNGAGKSTLFSLITRLFAARHGSIRILGTPIDRDPGAALARIGVVFQVRTLDLDLSVIDNLCYHAALHGIGPREARARAKVLLLEAGLSDRARDTVRKLSGGQMRRLEIARALLHVHRCCCSTSRRSGSTSHRNPRSWRMSAALSASAGSRCCGPRTCSMKSNRKTASLF